jgi:hypothetical protein
MSEWHGNKRADGLVVAKAIDGWIILPGDDRDALAACPSCRRPITSPEQAKRVADDRYPITTQR